MFSLVPIVGATSQLTSRVCAGIYGLYSTDPRVEILCISAPFQWNAHFAVNPIYEFISPPANVNGHYQRESQINIALDAGLTWKRLTLVYHYDRPLFRGRAKKG